jgi:hypothetical protein
LQLFGIWLIAGTALFWIGAPPARTNIDDFRYSSGQLEPRHHILEQATRRMTVSNLYAMPVQGSVLHAMELFAPMLPEEFVHPLKAFPASSAQDESARMLNAQYLLALDRLDESLRSDGVELSFARPLVPFAPVAAEAVLSAANRISPVTLSHTIDGKQYLYLPIHSDAAPAHPLLSQAIPVSPRHYYNQLLTEMSRQMGWLFLCGLLVMLLYLILVQRSWIRLLYIFAPLLITAIVIFVWRHNAGGSLTIVHLMAFALIIALALDYSAVAVSSGFAPEDLSKILLTGCMTIASFGVLALAKHPVLSDLGLTVTTGAATALIFTLLVRIGPREEKGLVR